MNHAELSGARCNLCPLRGKAPIPAPVMPLPGTVKLIVLNEPIGRGEEVTRQHLAGRSGGLLKKTLDDNGIRQTDTYLTSATLCRPEGDKEAKRAAECCAPRVLRELAQVAKENPDAPLLVLGKEALATGMGGRKLLYSRGFIWKIKAPRLDAIKAWEATERKAEGARKENLSLKIETARRRRRLKGKVAFISLAPSFISRADTWAPILRIDIARIGRWLKGGIAAPLEDTAKHRIWPGAGRKVTRGGFRKAVERLKEVVSLDVETDGINPHECGLLCVGLSDGVETTVLWPWSPGLTPLLNKWLRTRKAVVAHNGSFDRMVLANHGVR